MAREPSFRLAQTTNDNGQTSGGSWSSETFDPFAPTTLHPSEGFLLILNGVNANRLYNEITDSSGDPSEVSRPLQLTAPRGTLQPLLAGVGTGKVFGANLKWRFRTKHIDTGVVSGLSPVPDEGLNVGAEAIQGQNTYLGEKVFLRVESSNVPFGGDVIEYFRNTSNQQNVFYKVGEGAAGEIFEDDFSDDEIVLNENDLLENCPTWAAGVLWPVCKAHNHPTNRTLFYNIRRMGDISYGGTASVTPGSNVVTLNGGTGIQRYIHPNRIMQRFRMVQDGLDVAILDPTVYRIVEIANDGYTLYVTPEIQASAQVPAGVSTDVDFRIEDDRDGRAITFSETFKPWSVNPENTLYVGEDRHDNVQHVFDMGGVTYAHTNTALYAILNDKTEDPLLSAQLTKVSDEGCVGPRAGCITPWGWVYLHRDLGVRIFAGGQSVPLGAINGQTIFGPKDQFSDLSVGAMNTAVLAFDPYTNKLYLSYVGIGRSHLDQVLTFDFGTGVWRGPHPMRLQSFGRVLGSGGEDLQVFGDDLGNIYTPEASEGYDLTVNNVANTMSGTVAGVTTDSFDCNSATFDGTGDKRLRGAPIWFQSQAGVLYYSFIADIVGDDCYLVHPPVSLDGLQGTLAAGWTFQVGGIGWRLTTSYIDAGEPVQPKKATFIRTRFERDATGASVVISSDPEDTGTFVAVENSPVSTAGTIHNKVRVMRQGVAHKFRMQGLVQNAEPRITAALADMEIRAGTPSNV